MYSPRQQRRPQKARVPKGSFVAAALLIVIVIAGGFFLVRPADEPKKGTSNDTTQQTGSFNKKQNSLTDPASPWLVVNKKRPISPKDYKPSTLKSPAMRTAATPESPSMQVNTIVTEKLEQLAADAEAEGHKLLVVSGYRSYDTQTTVYNSEVKGFGQTQADKESARPGYSEHQTGWAVDLGTYQGSCNVKVCFADEPAGKWLAGNAYKYGFVIRYAKNKTAVTGYDYEPWHLRYVGLELSTEMHKQNIKTLEEFFDLPPAPNY